MSYLTNEYKNWLTELKSKIRSAQIKAAITVNSALISFYWDLGKMIAEKEAVWGSKLIEQIAIDLKREFSDLRGLSISNLKYCKRFYNFYQFAIGQQLVDQLQSSVNHANEIAQHPIFKIPWGHNILIFSKSNDTNEAHFYIQQTIENSWSRDTLALQIKSQLFIRRGSSITNFKQTLPDSLSDLAQQTFKDPYVFDFLSMTMPFQEKDIERQLITHITKFLLELGKGFAFIGQQYHLHIGETDYYIDLLFYHIKLKCYVVIELKNTKFIPEYAGKLNFYLSAVDSLVKQEEDKPTIGILLCRNKNNFETEFALRGIANPIGVSEFELTEILPDDLKSSLPSIEEIEEELRRL